MTLEDMKNLRTPSPRIGTVATSVRKEGMKTIVRYHNTDVVKFGGKAVTLDTGGWKTATTKRRMNQTADVYNLGYKVYQKKGSWFVDDMRTRRTIPFKGNKVTFRR